MSKAQEIHILIDGLNNRVHFLFRHVFSKMIGIRPVLTNDKEAFVNWQGAKLNYSCKRLGDELFIKPQGLLYQKGVRQTDLNTSEYNGVPVLFKSDDDSDFPFDIFSAIFYMITRYEEYLPFTPDKYGRFQVHDSIAYKLKIVDEPIVEIWIEQFKTFLHQRFEHFCYSHHKYHYIPTIDVDSAFAYRNKEVHINFGAIVRDLVTLRLGDLFKRTATLARIIPDPFNTFPYLEDVFIKKNKMPIFFYLAGNRGQYDKNISFRNKAMRDIVSYTAKFAEIGLHPSFASNSKPSLMEKEKGAIEAVSLHPVHKSRQHYLKMSFPNTFLNLMKIGVTEDYSMGFAQTIGFRAGTCKPYNFYDLSREKESDLRIVPFQAMDTTFKTYLKLNPQQAENEMVKIREKVKKYGGVFCIIWHNDTFATTHEGVQWRKVFENMLE